MKENLAFVASVDEGDFGRCGKVNRFACYIAGTVLESTPFFSYSS